METDDVHFKVVPNQKYFVFGEVQENDPLALTSKDKKMLKKMEKKENISQAELTTRIELTNRHYCTTPPNSVLTKSDDTVQKATSTLSTKQKKKH